MLGKMSSMFIACVAVPIWMLSACDIDSDDSARSVRIHSMPQSTFVSSLEIDKRNAKWLVTLEGVSRLDESGWRLFDSKNSGLPDCIPWDLAIDSQGVIWVGTSCGLANFDGDAWTVYQHGQNSAIDLVSSLDIDSHDNIWIFYGPYLEAGLAKFDGTDWTPYPYDEPDRFLDPGGSIYVDENDSKWITQYDGVLRFDTHAVWTAYLDFEDHPWTDQITGDGNGCTCPPTTGPPKTSVISISSS